MRDRRRFDFPRSPERNSADQLPRSVFVARGVEEAQDPSGLPVRRRPDHDQHLHSSVLHSDGRGGCRPLGGGIDEWSQAVVAACSTPFLGPRTECIEGHRQTCLGPAFPERSWRSCLCRQWRELACPCGESASVRGRVDNRESAALWCLPVNESGFESDGSCSVRPLRMGILRHEEQGRYRGEEGAEFSRDTSVDLRLRTMNRAMMIAANTRLVR